MGFEFKTDYKAAQEDGLIPAGEYEVYVSDAGMNMTNSGTHYFDVQFKVRDDIDQEQQGRRISDKLWLSEKAMPISEGKMQRMSLAVDLGNGKEYKSLEEWGNDMIGRFMKVNVTHRNGNDQYGPQAQVSRYSKTSAPAPLGDITGLAEAMEKKKLTQMGFERISNEELPF